MLYWKSTCTTCRDVRAALRLRRPDLAEKNYSRAALTVEEVRGIVQAAGGVAVVLNTTHALAKERGWKASPPDAETFAAETVKEPNLLRRPILVLDGRAWVGKSCSEAPL